MENSTSESGIFNSSLMHKINRECKPCIFKKRLKRNLTKYLFDFFYYRELYQICSANLFLYQCFTEYQLMTWKLEMNNIIDIFHLDIKNYDEEVDDTLTQCIKKKRTYSMKDHPGCLIRINKEGINIISLAYFDNSIQGYSSHSNNYSPNPKFNTNHEPSSPLDKNDFINSFSPIEKYKNFNNIYLINDGFNNTFNKKNTFESNSEITSNFGSVESINLNNNKINDSNPWEKKYVDDSYNNNECILLNKTTPINFGFSFYHVIKGDYQLYLHHSLINMKNARLNLQVTINGINVYTFKDFPPNGLFEQDKRDEKEKEKNIKLNEYLICTITKKMFEEASFNIMDLEENLVEDEQKKYKDYEVRVTFKNQDLFWKSGWCVDGGRLLRKIYEINDNGNKNYKRFKSENINIFGSIKKKIDNEEKSSNSLNKLKSKKRTSLDYTINK